MSRDVFWLTLLFFFLSATISYAQFEKQILLEVEGPNNSDAYRTVTLLDVDQDNDQDVVGEMISVPTFSPININFNNLLEDNAKSWNNFQQDPNANASIDLTDALGNATGATLTLNTTWNGAGQNGYDGERQGFYPGPVTRSYYFTQGSEEMTISGLNPGLGYKISFYGSSSFADDRTAIYRIGSQEVELNASFNTTNTVTIMNVIPDADGNVAVEVAKKPGVNFAFLGAMIIELNQLEPRQYKLLINNGQTPFSVGQTVDDAANWTFAKTADINQDGYPDLIVYDTEDEQLFWYENQSNNSFTQRTIGSDVPTFVTEDQLVLLDLNQDGKVDILVKDGNRLFWYEQASNNNFENWTLWAEGGTDDLTESSSVQGDIDGDGQPDLVWSGKNQVYLLLSENAYSLDDSIKVTGVNSPVALSVADMNGDSQDDLVITERYSWTGSYRIGYLANSNGSLGTNPVFLTVNGAEWLNRRPQRLLVDDVDKDGDNDFYAYISSEGCSSIDPAETGWIENNGNWQSAQYYSISKGESRLVDIDQDGDQDLVSDNANEGIYWTENADGNWGNATDRTLTQPVIDQIINVDIFSNDTDPVSDLIIQSSNHAAELTIQQGNILPPTIREKLASEQASVAQQDVDADGIPELFIADQSAEGFAVVRWQYSSTGLSQEIVTHKGSLSGQAIYVSASGLLFAPVNEAGDQYGWWKKNNDDFTLIGTFSGTVTQLADFNADGTTDVLTTSGWYKNISNTRLDVTNNAKGNLVVDFDGDGDLDIIDTSEANIVWYQNQGSNNFASKTLLIAGGETITFADLDIDGDADIIEVSSAGVAWRQHTDGNGTFAIAVSIDNFLATNLEAVDFDADGDNDIVAYDAQTLVQYENTFQRQENTAPTIDQQIDDQMAKADSVYQFQIPTDAFKDSDAGDILKFAMSQEDGTNLPDWLSFNANTQTLSGTPAASDTGTLVLRVQATDLGGATATQDFNLVVQASGGSGEPGDGGEEPGDGGEEPEDPVTGIGEEPATEIVLYPNPVKRGQAIMIKNLSIHNFIEGRIYSAQGQEMKLNLQKDSLQMNSAHLIPGVYLLEMRTTQQVHRQRIIVE